MPARKIILLLVALLIAGVTVLLAKSMLSSGGQPGATAQKAAQVQEILVATKDLPSGTLLKDADMKWLAWPMETENADYAIKGKSDKGDFVGNVVRYGLRAGEPIMTGRVVKPGQSGFMAAALSPGMRAVSISITPVAGVAGFVFPGDHVDVLVTHQVNQRTGNGVESGGERKVSETILQDVRVLALDQKMDDQVTVPKVAQIATLEVTAKQAEAIVLASQMGALSLALRSIAQIPAPTAAEGTTENGIAIESKPAAAADDGAGLTWDSDVSRVLPSPANRRGAVQRITIIRGKDVSESVYELTAPEGNQ